MVYSLCFRVQVSGFRLAAFELSYSAPTQHAAIDWQSIWLGRGEARSEEDRTTHLRRIRHHVPAHQHTRGKGAAPPAASSHARQIAP